MQPQGAPLSGRDLVLGGSTAWQGKAWFRQKGISKNERVSRERPFILL